jgi:hypothetical protein
VAGEALAHYRALHGHIGRAEFGMTERALSSFLVGIGIRRKSWVIGMGES